MKSYPHICTYTHAHLYSPNHTMQIHTMMKISYMEIMCVSNDFFLIFINLIHAHRKKREHKGIVRAVYKSGNSDFTRDQIADTLISDFYLQNHEEVSFCCLSHSVCGILLWQSKQMNTIEVVIIFLSIRLNNYLHQTC